MLRSNKDMWGCGTLQAIIDRRKKQNRDAAIARDGEMEETVDIRSLTHNMYATAATMKYQNKMKYIHLLLLLTWVYIYNI